MRTIAIGDIHGCSKALDGLLQILDPQPADCLVFLGDYVDRGPDSRGVIDMLLELEGRCKTVFLRGNHEIMFSGVLRGLEPTLWMQNGGSQTLTSYGGLLDHVPDRHREFLQNCVPHYETEKSMFVHANYVADLPLDQQPDLALYWEHLNDRWPEPHVSGKHVYCGHTPQTGGRIGWYSHFTCIDTCCFGGNWLTAVDVDSWESWQVSRQGHLRENWRLLKKIVQKIRKNARRYRS